MFCCCKKKACKASLSSVARKDGDPNWENITEPYHNLNANSQGRTYRGVWGVVHPPPLLESWSVNFTDGR